MKATIEFDLEDLDDVMAHVRCVKSLDMAQALFKIEGIIKDKWQYNSVEMQRKINEAFEEYDINLEDLIK